ncbi:OB-fold nucleic acid binding domain-containing protein, partial [Clostridium perfringens]
YKSYEIIQEAYNNIELPEDIIHDEERIILGGIVAEANQKITRSNSMMAFLKLEDLTGTIEVIVFPKTLDKVREFVKEDSLVVIKGRVSIKEDELPKLICETIEPLEKINTAKVYIRVNNLDEGKNMMKELRTMPKEFKGDTTVFVFTANDKKSYRMSKDIWINLESDAVIYFRELAGEDNVKVIE